MQKNEEPMDIAEVLARRKPQLIAKRAMDILLSACALAVLWPLLLTIISYVFCLLMMRKLNIPWYMTGIILASLVVSVICIAVNLKWKLSEHMAGIGGVIGGLVSFSALFGYNPVAWLCLFILIAGILGSARIILGHHTLGEVLSGFTVGLVAALLVLHPVSNLLFRVFLF